jgi:hypothetical protein
VQHDPGTGDHVTAPSDLGDAGVVTSSVLTVPEILPKGVPTHALTTN